MIVSMDSEPIIPTTEKKNTIFLYRSSISPRFYTQHNYSLRTYYSGVIYCFIMKFMHSKSMRNCIEVDKALSLQKNPAWAS